MVFPAFRGFACFGLFSLAPPPSPREGRAQAGPLEGERHVEHGQVPSVAPAEACLADS